MNDEDLDQLLDDLKAEHRRLDEQISSRLAEGADQLELARLKRQKLRIKDQIQLVVDQSIPDIIA
jgi:hypothetical protein